MKVLCYCLSRCVGRDVVGGLLSLRSGALPCERVALAERDETSTARIQPAQCGAFGSTDSLAPQTPENTRSALAIGPLLRRATAREHHRQPTHAPHKSRASVRRAGAACHATFKKHTCSSRAGAIRIKFAQAILPTRFGVEVTKPKSPPAHFRKTGHAALCGCKQCSSDS